MSESTPTCGWCDEPSVTEVIVRPGTKLRKTAPVCAEHAQHFENQGQMTTEREVMNKLEREGKRSQWKGRRTWR